MLGRVLRLCRQAVEGPWELSLSVSEKISEVFLFAFQPLLEALTSYLILHSSFRLTIALNRFSRPTCGPDHRMVS